MQNFMGIGPVVFAGEYLGMKIGCSSYNTSKPVDLFFRTNLFDGLVDFYVVGTIW